MESQDDDKLTPLDPAAAAEALAAVDRLRRAALYRGLPPRWFGVSMAVLVGGLSGAQAADAPQEIIAALFVALMAILALKSRMLLALSRRSSYGINPLTISIQIAAVVLVLATTIAGKIAYTRMDLAWAPVAAAVATTVVLYLLFELKLSEFRANIELREHS